LAAVLGLFALSSPEQSAALEPPLPAVKPAVPAPIVVPEVPKPAAIPVPVIPQPSLPKVYTQKPQVILDPVTNDIIFQLEPEPNEAVQPPAQPATTDEPPPAGATPAPQVQAMKRAWGPEQAEGAPDTPGAGDIQSAWASLTPDGQKEWLICEFAEPVLPTAIVVHETYNPGSLEKISVFDADGQEQEVWTGTDPTPRTAARGISIIPIKTKFNVQKVKLYFDSPAVPGWNEIDAIGLRSKDDNMQWAMKVTASTTYAQQEFEPAPPMVVVPLEQLQRLQQDVDDLKKQLEGMKQMEADIKELKELIKDLKK
jgi:hypothetical protein